MEKAVKRRRIVSKIGYINMNVRWPPVAVAILFGANRGGVFSINKVISSFK